MLPGSSRPRAAYSDTVSAYAAPSAFTAACPAGAAARATRLPVRAELWTRAP